MSRVVWAFFELLLWNLVGVLIVVGFLPTQALSVVGIASAVFGVAAFVTWHLFGIYLFGVFRSFSGIVFGFIRVFTLPMIAFWLFAVFARIFLGFNVLTLVNP